MRPLAPTSHGVIRITAISVIASALAACGDGPTSMGTDSEDEVDGRVVIAQEWTGLYEGPGEGTSGGSSHQVPNARLTIRLDADSVKLDECPHCVSIVLDTVASSSE